MNYLQNKKKIPTIIFGNGDGVYKDEKIWINCILKLHM
jgi:hypothetical protein